MKNQRLERIVELMGEGNLATAEDLIKLELCERADAAKEAIKRGLVGSVLESSVTSTVWGLGEVTIDGSVGQIRLSCGSLSEAVAKGVAFAAFCDGVPTSSYKASLNESKTAVVIESDGAACYEMPLEDGQLVNTAQVSSADLLQFKKNGTLASV